MKKILTVILSVFLLLSCSTTNDNKSTDNVSGSLNSTDYYIDTWSCDETHHWHETTDGKNKKDYEEHSFPDDTIINKDNYLVKVCTVCGYQQKVSDTPISNLDITSVHNFIFWNDIEGARYEIYVDGARASSSKKNIFKVDGYYTFAQVWAFNDEDQLIAKGVVNSSYLEDKKILVVNSKEQLESTVDLSNYNAIEINALNGNFSDFHFTIPNNINSIKVKSDRILNNNFYMETSLRNSVIHISFEDCYISSPSSNDLFKYNASEGYTSYSIISLFGNNTLIGGDGLNGENATGSSRMSGQNGGNGRRVINAQNLLIEGNGSTSIIGGNGGKGGIGTHGSTLSSPGNGGNGGNGEVAIFANQIYALLDENCILNIAGGNGGDGGRHGNEGTIQLAGFSDGQKGQSSKGTNANIYLFSGLLMANSSEIIDKSDDLIEMIPDGLVELAAPIVKRIGDILSWEPVEGATFYEVTFRDNSLITINTCCRLEAYKLGGYARVKALEKNIDGEIIALSKSSNRISILPSLITNAEYEEYILDQLSNDIHIGPTINDVYIEGKNRSIGIYIENRTTPLHITLKDVDTNYLGIVGNINEYASLDTLVTIDSIGTSNVIYGKKGGNGVTGHASEGMWDFTGNGGNGENGYPACRLNYVLIEGTAPIYFYGGSGGTGGKGGKGGWYALPGNGGNGGNGGLGLETINAYVYLTNAALVCSGGDGGSFGPQGDGGSLLTGYGSDGRNGSRGANYNVSPVYLQNVSKLPLGENDLLDAPIIVVEDGIVKWGAVNGANCYQVSFSFNGVIISFETTENEYLIDYRSRTSDSVKVKALYKELSQIIFESLDSNVVEI